MSTLSITARFPKTDVDHGHCSCNCYKCSRGYLGLFVFQICLRLILVSGRTHEFIFSPNDTVNHITRHVYENWPEGM